MSTSPQGAHRAGRIPAIDLDDGEALLAADHDGALRGAATAGAQVRATAAAVEEGALAGIGEGGPPRTVTWLSGRGTAGTAGSMLAAVTGSATAAPLVLVDSLPPWLGPLDVLVVAGDDPGDPALVAAAAGGVRRGARVVVATPYEGPLRDATAGRAAVLEPRLPVPEEFGLARYLAVGLGVLGIVERGVRPDLTALADDLDAEALRNSAMRESFVNPAKAIAERVAGCDAVLAGDCAATVALARHGSATMLRVGHTPVAACWVADAVTALRNRRTAGADDIFHDELIDGPAPPRLRILALTLAAERTVVAARVGGLDGVDIVDARDVPDGPGDLNGGDPLGVPGPVSGGVGSAEQQLAVLALRLEMAAAYLRLLRG